MIVRKPNMDIQQLRAFIMVAHMEHLTHAADELHMSQPALSSSISRLESELNIKLFDRIGRNIKVNEAGRAFLPYAEESIIQMEKGIAALNTIKSVHEDHISIQTMPLNTFPGLFQEIFSVCPTLTISSIDTPLNMSNNLLSGSTDICITASTLHNSKLSSETAFTETVGILTANSHPLARHSKISLDALKEETFTCLSNSTLTLQIDEVGKRGGFTPHISFKANQLLELINFVESGQCIAIIGCQTFKQIALYLDVANLSYIKIDGEPIKVTRTIYWNRNNKNPLIPKIRKTVLDYFDKL